MKGKNRCAKCRKTFEWERSKKQLEDRGGPPRFCSAECKGHTGFRPGCSFRISELTKEQKKEKIRLSFEKNVVRKEGCWDWKGTFAKGGYPVMTCDPKYGVDRGHRASWVLHKGPIPKGMQVCHSCDNPRCTNPEHLWLGTHRQNNDDKISKGRQRYSPPPHKPGILNGSAKLNEDQVKEIRILLKKGLTSRDIGAQYSVSKTTILRIKNGTNWKHIEEAC